MDFNRYITAAEFAPLAELFRTEGHSRIYLPGEAFARQDERNPFCGLVTGGAFRYVHLTAEGNVSVVGYAFSGEFVGDYISMSNGLRSWVGIEAMCRSSVSCLGTDVWRPFTRRMRLTNCSDAGWPSICRPRSTSACCSAMSPRRRSVTKPCCDAVPIC